MYNGGLMAHFYVLGLGVEPRHHATIEVLQALGRCDVIYAQGLTKDELRYLERFQPRRFWKRLPAGEPGPGLHAALTRDLKSGHTAAWVTRGHPFYWNSIATQLVKTAQRLGVSWSTYGAVSPMGLALADMGVALGDEVQGLQSFDFSALTGDSLSVNPEWPLVLYSYGALKKSDFDSAVGRLLRIYPAAHPVEWRQGFGRTETLSLGILGSRFGDLDVVSVICLPSLRRSRSKLGRTSEKPMPRTPERAATR